jgi:mannonate dehydratase
VIPRALRASAPYKLGDVDQQYADEMLAGLKLDAIWDMHVHIVGLGAGGTGIYVHPEMTSGWHPMRSLQFDVYREIAGIQSEETADADYIRTLMQLHRLTNPAGKFLMMAFDYAVDEKGDEQPERSTFFVPNRYAAELAAAHTELEAIASIHPYRKDAVERLEEAAKAGAVAVKWLPNAMGMDPASPLCDEFYDAMERLNLPLISHAGHEYAVDGSAWQELGNPLRLRRALEHGVRVIVAHCASYGSSDDLDRGGRAPSFDLFTRMFEEESWGDQLLGDFSVITALNRSGRPLRTILERRDWHRRLVHGSDWPLPAIGPAISLRQLKFNGYLDENALDRLSSIRNANPMLFDLLLKRALRNDPTDPDSGLANAAFETRHWFDRSLT